jgi:hypothetical protein
LNASPNEVQWTFPRVTGGHTWIELINTFDDREAKLTEGPVTLAPYSLALLSHTSEARIQQHR